MIDPATTQQSTPKGSGEDIARLMQSDVEARAVTGASKYGERLKPNNGRDALIDAYQEALDLGMYLRQKIEQERQHKARIGLLYERLMESDYAYDDCANMANSAKVTRQDLSAALMGAGLVIDELRKQATGEGKSLVCSWCEQNGQDKAAHWSENVLRKIRSGG